jgi:hypothetical protein
MGGASSSAGSLDVVQLRDSASTSSGEDDLSLEEGKTLVADKILKIPTGEDTCSSTFVDVLLSRLEAVGSFDWDLAMKVG